MAAISASRETNNWSERFKEMFEALNGPGSLTLDDNSVCPFCEDKDRIPVVINNSLSAEIQKIPLQIICEEAGLFGSQVREILKAKAHNDYVVEKFYTEVYGKALALKQGNYFDSGHKLQPPPQSQLDHVQVALTPSDINSNNCFRVNEIGNIPVGNIQPTNVYFDPQAAQNVFSNFTPNVTPNLLGIIPELKIINWQGISNFDIWNGCTQQLVANDCDTWTTPIDKRLYLSYNSYDDSEDDEDDDDTRDFIPPDSKREVENLCRLKDPYLLAVNAAIFGNTDGNYPQEGTEDYYKAAQQCALFGVTFSDPDNVASTSLSSSTRSAESSTTNRQFNRTTDSEIKCNDSQIDRNMKQPQQQSMSQQSNSNRNVLNQKSKILNPINPTDTASAMSSITGAARNIFAPAIFCNANTGAAMNQYPQPLVGLNISQKPKVLPPTAKFLPKGINFLSPQQILLQSAIQKNRQAANYPYTAGPFQQTLAQPQHLLYTNPLLAAPYLNACFKETHINTSIIQQQQYNFFGAGTYEMLIYAQMLQQTQTVISKNRAALRNSQDLARASSNISPLLPPPTLSANNPAQNLPRCSSSNAAANPVINFPIKNSNPDLFSGTKMEDSSLSLQTPNMDTNGHSR